MFLSAETGMAPMRRVRHLSRGSLATGFGMAQNAARQGAVILAFGDDRLAVDKQVSDSAGILVRLVEGRPVPEILGVEHDDVGEVALFEIAALLQSQNIRRQSAGAANGRFQR